MAGLVNTTSLSALAASAVVYVICLVVYRLLFSPIAHLPGPWLAAATQWYEFYYDVVLPGQFYLHIEKLHDKYGPIIRINPWEVLIRDPDYYETVYSSTARRHKVPAHQWSGLDLSIVNSVPHELHRQRRKALNPLFSKHQIQQKFGTFIQSRADLICDRLAHEYAATGKVLNWNRVWSCFAGDNVMQFCFATNQDFLHTRDFFSSLIHALDESLFAFHFLFQFPLILPIMKLTPDWAAMRFFPDIAQVMAFEQEIKAQIKAIIIGKNTAHNDVSHTTVFKEVLNSDLPPAEKTVERLYQDGFTLVTAGMETTSYALQLAIFHVLNNPSIHKKLCDELLTNIPSPADILHVLELEKLPYLTAVITEAIRLTYGNLFRLPRTADEPLHYGPYKIPPGTPVSITSYSIHHNETLFPQSHSFIPERWLDKPTAPVLPAPFPSDHVAATHLDDNNKAQKLLSRYMVSFSRGSRQCIGMHLAYAEIYIGLATVFRRVDMKLYDTKLVDVEARMDMFVPKPLKGSKGVRVLVEAVE